MGVSQTKKEKLFAFFLLLKIFCRIFEAISLSVEFFSALRAVVTLSALLIYEHHDDKHLLFGVPSFAFSSNHFRQPNQTFLVSERFSRLK